MTAAKAIVGALVTLLGTIGAAIEDGAVDTTEVGIIVAAVLVAYAAIFQTPNRPA